MWNLQVTGGGALSLWQEGERGEGRGLGKGG